MAQVRVSAAGPDQPGGCGSAVDLDQHVLGRQPDGGGIRVERRRSTSRGGRCEVSAVDRFDFAQHRALGRRVGDDPADPGVALAAVEKEPVDAVHGGVGGGRQDDLRPAPSRITASTSWSAVPARAGVITRRAKYRASAEEPAASRPAAAPPPMTPPMAHLALPGRTSGGVGSGGGLPRPLEIRCGAGG